MKIEDAKKKWCPHVRTGLIQGMAVNHTVNMTPDGKGYVNLHDETRCIGPDCMMWQWKDEPGSAGWFSATDGYCGLAGDRQ